MSGYGRETLSKLSPITTVFVFVAWDLHPNSDWMEIRHAEGFVSKDCYNEFQRVD